jgi:hypothetical protein
MESAGVMKDARDAEQSRRRLLKIIPSVPLTLRGMLE